MCGRYTLATPAEELVEAFDLPGLTFDYFARFNIGPGQAAPIVAEDAAGRRIGLLDWGLVPAWMNDPGRGFINARAESVASKASFREAFRRRRCLVPADGFYEWQAQSEGETEAEQSGKRTKRPFWLHPSCGGVVSFAGIWETWSQPGAAPRHTFAVLTTEANSDVRAIHDRMPVVVEEGDRGVWLDRSSEVEKVSALMRPAPDGTFASHRVSTRVNSVIEDDAGLIELLA